jgi:uncharacterized protein (DUF169 family)
MGRIGTENRRGAGPAGLHGVAGILTTQHGAMLSLGCMGNRVYTGLGEDEMYFVLRGKDLAAVAEVLGTITRANARLQEYAKGRREELATL